MINRADDSDTVIRLQRSVEVRKTVERLDIRSRSSITLGQEQHNLGFKTSVRLQRWFQFWYRVYHIYIRFFLLTVCILLFNIYLCVAIKRRWNKTPNMCEGIKFLSIIVLIAMVMIIYFLGIKPLVAEKFKKKVDELMEIVANKYPIVFSTIFRIFIGVSICLAITLMVMLNSENFIERCISFIGILVKIFFGYLFSNNRKMVDWSLVTWGVTVQFILGFIMLRWPIGRWTVECICNKISHFILYSDRGTEKLFSYLVTGVLNGSSTIVMPRQSFVMPFKIFTIILYINVFTSILYYYSILQFITIKLGWLLHKVIGTTAVESMSAAANIFLGNIEAPLMVKQYLKRLTRAEIHCVMTAGFATISGTVLAAFIALGVDGTHLVTAAVLSAPAALAYAKLTYPETDVTRTTSSQIAKLESAKEQSLLEAAIQGVYNGIILVINIAANLVVFITLIKIVDSLLEWFGSLVKFDHFNTQTLLAWLFTPFAFSMGVEWKDCGHVGELIGLRTVINEFVAFLRLIELQSTNQISRRSSVIAIYGICGFCNPGSVGIAIGGLGALVPEKIADITAVAIRAMLAASIACMLTAGIAGVIMED